MSNLSNILAKYKPQNFSYLKSATIFSLFALFFVFIDAQDLEAECNGDCSSTPWTYSSDAEQIYLHIDGGCDILISYRYKECLVGGVIKRDLQITSMKMSASCSGMSENQIMYEAIKRVLWKSHSIFNVIGPTHIVNMISQNCWNKTTVSDTLRFLPCDSTYCCVVTDTIVKTDYNYKITGSSQIPATDTTCFRPVGGFCGSYICNSQIIPLNTPLYEPNEYECGNEDCFGEWINFDNYVEYILPSGCTYRSYFIIRYCNGVIEIAVTRTVQIGTCSTTDATTAILSKGLASIAQYVKNTYAPIPNIRFLIKSCWQTLGIIRYPCTYETCCVADYTYNSILNRYVRSSPTWINCNPLPTSCVQVCNGQLYPDEYILSKISIENNSDFVKNIKIYPNPFNEYLNIEYISEDNDLLKIQIYDILGIVVFEEYSKVVKGQNIIELKTNHIVNNKTYYINLFNQNMELIYNDNINK